MTPKIEQWKRVKKEKGLTNQDIADLSGLPLGSIKNIFAGYTDNPRIDTVQAIEKALGLSSKLPIQESKKLSKDEERLLSFYSSLIPSMQEYVLQMVEALADQPQNRT